MPTEYDGYTLDKWGYVTDLGKFEGEHWRTIALYDLVMDGFSDDTFYPYEDGTAYDIFIVDSEEFREDYELYSDTYAVIVYTDSQGFVFADQYTETGYSFFLREVLGEEEQGYE